VQGFTAARWIAGASCLIAAGCGGGAGPDAVPPEQRARGVTLSDWTADGYRSPGCSLALDEIAAAGATSVALIVTWYQDDPATVFVSPVNGRTPTDAALSQAVVGARQRGLSVTVKPHVDVLDGTWRANIRPELPELWFQIYGGLLVPLAERAAAWGAERFVIGTELAGLAGEEALWRDLIDRVRQVYPGRIVYSASWDEAMFVSFWDAVDEVGVSAYFPVAVRTNPTRVDLLAGWQVWRERMARLHQRTGKPVLFTEIGYRSVDGAGMRPYVHDSDPAEDAGEQADLYWAALHATRDDSWLSGMYWWDWRVDGSGGPGNRDYTPFRKPAADVLRSFWGEE